MDPVLRDRLLGAAEGTEQVGRDDPLPAEAAEDRLVREADRFRYRRDTIC